MHGTAVKTIVPLFRGRFDSWRWDPIGCPETSVRSYHRALRNTPEERRFHQHRCRSLKPRGIPHCVATVLWYWPRKQPYLGQGTGITACPSVKLFLAVPPAEWLWRGFSIIIYPWHISRVLKNIYSRRFILPRHCIQVSFSKFYFPQQAQPLCSNLLSF